MLTRKMLGVSLIALIASSGIAFATPAVLPSNGTFTSGTGQISTSGSTETVTINRTSPGLPTPPASIDWKGGYDVAAGKTVTYAAGSGTGSLPSVVVNNDTSGAASNIDGTINSPGFAQVIVNPDGISVGPSAVLPGSVALAAGTYDSSTEQVTASTAPVTIAPGVTYGAAPGGQQFASVTVNATTGDTLPDTHGTTAAIDVPAQSTNGATQKFSLYQNQELTGEFLSQSGSSTPEPVSIDGGSTNGVTVSSISIGSTNGGDITVEHVAASGGIVVGANPNGFNFSSTGATTAGDLTAAGASAAGGVTISEQGPVTIDGNLTATGKDGSVLITTSGGDAYAPPGQTGSTVTIDPNLSLLASDGQVDISGNTVSLPASLTISGTSFQIYSNQPLAGLNGNSVIDVTQNGGQYASYTPQLAAPSISGLTINDSGSNSYQFQVEANTVTNSVFNVPTVGFFSAGYENNGNFYDGATLTLKNVTLGNIGGTGAPSFLTVQGTNTSIDMSNLTEGQPAAGQITNLNVVGTPDVTITGSKLYGTGSIDAGQATFTGAPVSGNVVIDNSTMTGSGSDQIVAYDGGTVNIGSGTKISINQSGACDTSGQPCDTYLSAKNIGFLTGNSETASDANWMTGSASGTANAAPGETNITAQSFSPNGNSIQIATSANGSQNAGASGTINIAGTLDAGHPAVVPPPVTPPANNGGGSNNGGGGSNGGGKTTTSPTVPDIATKIVTVAPVQIAPSSSITSIQQRGSTVLVPETPGSNAAPVSVSQPSAGQVGTPGVRKQLR